MKTIDNFDSRRIMEIIRFCDLRPDEKAQAVEEFSSKVIHLHCCSFYFSNGNIDQSRYIETVRFPSGRLLVREISTNSHKWHGTI